MAEKEKKSSKITNLYFLQVFLILIHMYKAFDLFFFISLFRNVHYG